ncbi:MAG: hypothetical protein M1819_002005 [Sarea resinae]|nr:MAG: hypothetical protein M1819_002005 [Sarea resinae]
MTFGRLVQWITPLEQRQCRILWIPTRHLATSLSLFESLACFVQVLGIWLFHTNNNLSALIAGLALQLCCCCVFVAVAARFNQLSRGWTSFSFYDPESRKPRLVWAVVGAVSLMLLQTLYGLISLSILASSSSSSSSANTYLCNHEWPFWVFAVVPVLATFLVFNVVHPAAYLPGAYSRFQPIQEDPLNAKDGLPMYERSWPS